MKILARAKKVRFHVASGGKDCFSLEDLKAHFNLADVKKLIRQDTLVGWLQSFQEEEAARVIKELKQQGTDISENAVLQIFFPKMPDETDYDYLLRNQHRNIYDTLWHALYQTDIKIAIHCLQNHLLHPCMEIPADRQPDTYYFTKANMDAFYESTQNDDNDQQLAELYFVYGKSLLKTGRHREEGKDFIQKASQLGYQKADEYAHSNEYAALCRNNQIILDHIRNKFNSHIDLAGKSFDYKHIKNFITEFANWADHTEGCNQYPGLVDFIIRVCDTLLKYNRNKDDTFWEIDGYLQRKRPFAAPNYEQCFWGI